MRNFETCNIRNISLLGHRGSGKTTLTEALLYISKFSNKMGSVEEGTTVSDFDKEETETIFDKHFNSSCRIWRLQIQLFRYSRLF